MIEGEQVVMKIHQSRIIYFKYYFLALILIAAPFVLGFLKINLPIPAAYVNYIYIAPITTAALIIIIFEISIRRNNSYITNYRVINSRGILKKTYDSCTFDKMVNVRVIQSFPQRILRIGTIDITTFQRSEIILSSIPNPYKIERTIYNLIEKVKVPGYAAQQPVQPPVPEESKDEKKK
jgi:uncharacterized membrane protein YdbT with pleckstrin-like domain